MLRLLLAIALLAAVTKMLAEPAYTPPNIILFIGDDIDARHYGFQGNPIVHTPHLDQLARQGMVFTEGYSSASVCVPALRTLLGGIHDSSWSQTIADAERRFRDTPRRRHVRHFPFTLPRLLRAAGYKSFAGGKMWEGNYEDAGFDSGTMVEPPIFGLKIDNALEFGRESMAPLFHFIDRQTGPWFAWVAPTLPHTPHDPPPEYLTTYDDPALLKRAISYLGNITRMDSRIGDIVSFLEHRGIRSNTMVIYLGDNGWDQALLEGEGRSFNEATGGAGKLSVHDRGFRTPIVVNWPGKVPAGARNRSLVTFADVYRTILDYAGAPTNPCSPGESFRQVATLGRGNTGRDLVVVGMSRVRRSQREIQEAIQNGQEKGNRFVRRGLGMYARDRRWAYSQVMVTHTESLYDLANDPLATQDVSSDFPTALLSMRKRAFRTFTELRKPCSLDS